MQACRLSFAQAHPSQVGKVLFDAVSSCVALLLEDSSCLLYSLLCPESSPLWIPPYCTDACFLRLQTRQPAISVPSLCPAFLPRGDSGPAALEFQRGWKEQGGAKDTGDAVQSGRSEVGEGGDAGLRSSGRKHVEGEWSVRNLGHIKIGGDAGVGDAMRERDYRKKSNEAGSWSQGFFLSVMPGGGGSCTYIKAWVCDPPSFVRIGVQLQGQKLKNSCSQLNNGISHLHTVLHETMARIDIPHGFAVKIAASVNAFVIYSPSVGKTWIMSGKLVGSQQRMHNEECSGNCRLASDKANEEIPSAETRVRQCHREEIESYLCLIKCAIVDCNGPVYALHLSRQHLFLGQSGGLRVWRLRPLIKGFNRLRRKAVKKDNSCCPDSNKEDCIGNTGEDMDGTRVGSYIESSKKITVKEQYSDGWLNTRSNGNMQHANREVILFDKARQKNGLIQRFCDMEGVGNNYRIGLNPGVCGVSFEGDKSLTCRRVSVLEREEDGGSRDDCLRGNPQEVLAQKFSGKGMNVDLHRKASQANGITEVHDQFISACNEPMRGLALGCTSKSVGSQGKNGLLYHNFHRLEDLPSQHQFSQSSTVSSSSSSVFVPVSSLPVHALPAASSLTSHGSSPSSVSCCSLSSAATVSLPSMCGTFDNNPDHVQNHVEDFIRDEIKTGSFFVPFSNKNKVVDAVKKAKPTQVVCIQSLSERLFVILDSCGKLHLLTLQQHSVTENGQKELKRIALVGKAFMQPLNCAVRVKLFAVLPSAQQNASIGSPSVPSKLWISDGSHSLYVFSLPEMHVPEEERDNCVEDVSKLTVNQVVFMAEHVRALTAMLDNTMVVLTEGSILAYSMAGT
eukprot:c27791_g1_i4 orf=627-3164(-)